MAHLQTAGNISDAVGGAITLADIRQAQGRPREAARTYEQALQLITTQGVTAFAVRGTSDVRVGLSEILGDHTQPPECIAGQLGIHDRHGDHQLASHSSRRSSDL